MDQDEKFKKVADELMHTRASFKKVQEFLGIEMGPDEKEVFNKEYCVDCETCGTWGYPSDMLNSKDGEKICEDCKSEEDSED